MPRFDVRAEHLKLLRNANVGWDDCEFGAPAIDCKRPYGNSDVPGDIAKLLDIKPSDDEDEPFTEAQMARMRKLHEETRIVLQIILATGEFMTGVYEASDYKRDWKRVGDGY